MSLLLSHRNSPYNWILDRYLQCVFRTAPSPPRKRSCLFEVDSHSHPQCQATTRLCFSKAPPPHEILSPKHCAIEISLCLLEALGLASSMLEFSQRPLRKLVCIWGVSGFQCALWPRTLWFSSGQVPLHGLSPNLSSSKCPPEEKMARLSVHLRKTLSSEIPVVFIASHFLVV